MKLFVKLSIAVALIALVVPAMAAGFLEIKLVSDIPGFAKFTDPDLVNPWGLAVGSDCNLYVADNGTGVATVYRPDGTKVPRTIVIPGPGGVGPSAPSGEVWDVSNDFIMQNAAHTATATALLIWDTEDGTIAAWSPAIDPNNAVLQVDNSGAGAVYKGLALCPLPRGNSLLFATNFASGFVEVYDTHFNFRFQFTDTKCIPPDFAPFGIRCINGLVYVTYAKREVGGTDDVAGPGNGFVVVFNTKGQVVKRLIAHGPLNSPWGLVIARGDFGNFGGTLLVGNFGDGKINAFDPFSGAFLGTLRLPNGQPIVNDGLWGLEFLPVFANNPPRLYFNAGLNHEADGLFGYIFPVQFFPGPSLPRALGMN